MKKFILIFSLALCANVQAQNWQQVADTSISVMGPANIQFYTLDSSREYKLVSSGIWGDYWNTYHYDTRYNINGAAYVPYSDFGVNAFMTSPAWLYNLAPNPNVYGGSGNNDYEYFFTATANDTIVLTYVDNGYTDNFGTVRFQLYVNCPNQNHPVASDVSLCGMQDANLVANNATNYTWYDSPAGGNVLSTSDSLMLMSIAQTDTFYVSTMHFSGCESDRDTVIVTVNTLPNVTFSLPSSDDTTCLSNGAYTITGESPSGGTFAGPGMSGNNFDPTTAGTGTHAITYTYVDTNGCSGNAMQQIYVDVCLGAEQTEVRPMKVYPNPTSGIFQITLPGGTNSAQVEVLTVTGQTVIAEEVTNHGNIDASGIANGIYMVRVTTTEEVVTTMLEKE